MKIESLDEALWINALTGLPLKVLLTEEMLKTFKMTPEQYDRIAYSCENGDTTEFDKLSEIEKCYFRERFEEWEYKHCVCAEARNEGAR